MKLIEFPEQTVVIAKDQPQYLPMPAHRAKDVTGTTTICWKLTWWERLQLLLTGKLWHQICTFNTPMPPQHMQVAKPWLDKEGRTWNMAAGTVEDDSEPAEKWYFGRAFDDVMQTIEGRVEKSELWGWEWIVADTSAVSTDYAIKGRTLTRKGAMRKAMRTRQNLDILLG